MIVIYAYNPNAPQETEDEEQLATMLAAIVHHRVRVEHYETIAKDEVQQAHWKAQKKNCDRLIAKVFPLLGLAIDEIFQVIENEKSKWPIGTSGKNT